MGFTFKQFHIEQDHCGMKVGTDGVLLGAWAKGGKKILDIGTGTGLIALMMAQRHPKALIEAVEINSTAAEQAEKNFEHSPFKKRIILHKESLQQFYEKMTSQNLLEHYDAIVSNPPFFINSMKNSEQNKSMARHADTLPYQDLMKGGERLLHPNGTFSLIVPIDCKDKLESEAVFNGFTISKIVYLKTKMNKVTRRILVEFKKKSEGFDIEWQCLMDEQNNKSDWYKNLTKEFYIK